MTLRALILATAAVIVPFAGHAMTLEIPGNAVRSLETTESPGSYDLPLSGWQDGEIDMLTAEGAVLRQVWKIPSFEQTTLQLLEPLRQQLTEAGYEIAFECTDKVCGGFDFRFAIDAASEPEMRVDLGDFRFLSARRGSAGETPKEVLSLLVSRSNENGFVQITHVGPASEATSQPTTSTKSRPGLENLPVFRGAATFGDATFGDMLEQTGYVVLSELIFETGSSELDHREYTSLAALAEYLQANPDRRVSLVGHTDAEGSLARNVSLSKRRAESVMQLLASDYGVNARQMNAQGMGFLSPRASNLTAEGRQLNRRVEVIMTSTE
ncbi:MAG: OmpA family protein [Halocynthiibacter sp.]